jgi:putative hydrolase of the HAD superfamily
MKFTGIEHIFFDLDHTLWDFDLNSKLAYKQIFQERNIPLDLEQFIGIYEPLNLEFWRRFRESEINKEQLRYQRLKSAFDACDYEVNDNEIDLIADLYIAYLPNNNHLFDGCMELLDALKPKYKLHLITNGFEEVQHLKVKQAGLLSYFDLILTGEAAGVKKPHPDIFHQALARTGARVDNSIMIGDSLDADIKGAQSIGMPAIWFYRTDELIPEGQLVARELNEIHSFFDL